MTVSVELIDELDLIQSQENQGRGIQCVRTIVLRLRQGEFKWAASIRRSEGDKTRMYPQVEKILFNIFGCRLHFQHNCPSCLPIE